MSFKRKKIRLDKQCYSISGGIFAVTIGTAPRREIFTDTDFGLECIETLRQLSKSKGTPVCAYCLMPDHVHLLMGVDSACSLNSFVGTWKSMCYQISCRRRRPEPFWQRSYYDRALRREDDLLQATGYILNNPVRSGLVADYHHYPLCGSLEFNL
ncbi:MAG TPA: transposase [Acidobacteriota bacterium]